VSLSFSKILGYGGSCGKVTNALAFNAVVLGISVIVWLARQEWSPVSEYLFSKTYKTMVEVLVRRQMHYLTMQ
jgi:hypothetical protein